jgi:hypothetical protein
MKTFIPAFVLVALATFLAAPPPVVAQTADTLVVSANPPMPGSGPLLDQFIMGDTTAGGLRNNPNRVYVLQQTGSYDTTYYINSSLNTNFNLTIIGKKNPTTGNLPLIQPFIRQDNSSATLFVQPTKGTVILRNLYVLGRRIDGASGSSLARVVNANGNNITFIADHCVFDDMNNANILDNNGDSLKMYVTNCEFRNIQAPFWQGGSIFWSEGGKIVDTLEFVNNTFFCVMRAIYGNPKWFGYLLFNHNTAFMGAGGTLLSGQLSNAVITNNIFYGLMAHGADSAYIKAGSANVAHQGFGVVMIDTLTSLLNPPFNLTEADRNVTVANNAYFWPAGLYTYWKAVTDTAQNHPGLITPPQWMNPQTAYMFSNPARWPGFVQANNDSVDPGFTPALVETATDSLTKFVNIIWSGLSAGDFRWAQNRTDPTNPFGAVPQNWTSYPVPENLRYSNTALQTAGTDGKALGDLNWFPEQITAVGENPNTTPTKFTLSQNYPNPFNPTTEIMYSVSQNSVVSLKVFNLLGQEIATLVSGKQQPGNYVATFDASKLVSGVYFYRLQAGNFTSVKKMVLLK